LPRAAAIALKSLAGRFTVWSPGLRAVGILYIGMHQHRRSGPPAARAAPVQPLERHAMTSTNAPASAATNDLPHGLQLLHDPALNKGTAFTEQERDALGLRGLLPDFVLSQEQQAMRFLESLRRLSDDLDKYVALNALHDRNEALFFRVVCDNIDEMQPLIY